MSSARYALGVRLVGVIAAGALLVAGSAAHAQKVKMAVPSFLTGAAAAAFGIPAKNGAELIIRGINNGELPAPYDAKGLAGREIEAVFYDESGGNTKQVTEMRNKVQKEGVEVIAGIISSGTCAATTPVSEELKVLTIQAICGTPRVFEEIDTDPKYVFRTINTATANNVSAARYLASKYPDKVKGYIGINQNYAWGQDSLRDFELAMKTLMPKVHQAEQHQFPKLFSGQYGTEISALSRAKENLIHSSFWGGDLEAFMGQAEARGLFQRKMFVFTVGETAAYRLGDKFPQGIMVGTRGPYGAYVVDDPTPLNQWFQKEYRKAYGEPPTQPSYQYGQAVIAAKYAYDAAGKKAGKFPTTDEVIAALTGATFPTFVGDVQMALSKGHQAVTDDRWGVTKYDEKRKEVVMTDVVVFPPACVNPPDGKMSEEWLKGGMKGAKC